MFIYINFRPFGDHLNGLVDVVCWGSIPLNDNSGDSTPDSRSTACCQRALAYFAASQMPAPELSAIKRSTRVRPCISH